MGLTLEQRVAVLEAEVRGLKADKPIGSRAPIEVNLDTDKYADFAVRKSPPNWLTSGGHDFSGENISNTTPEFCDAIAEFLDWQAARDEEKNYSYVNGKGKTVFPAQYARQDAARARAWAKRLREEARKAATMQAPQGGDSGDDECPF